MYRLDEHTALVQTVDFFTPIVDDPRAYGEIAAANALSDVYAMGGTPISALSVAAFPTKDLEPQVVAEIVAGGSATLRRAGVALLGGHTVRDTEIKFGYAVTGLIDPTRIWTNAGAVPGDVLLLTKALGTGIVATAIKRGVASTTVADAAIESMRRLNRAASMAIAGLPVRAVHACTDVTGFGLVGHASEMALASRATVVLEAAALPFLPGAVELAVDHLPGGGESNRSHFGASTALGQGLSPALTALLFDPQTSGGLLVAIDPQHADEAVRRLVAADALAAIVGRVEPLQEHAVRVEEAF